MIGDYSVILVLILTAVVQGLASSFITYGSTSPPPPLREEQKDKAVAALESSLLKLFGLSRRPRPTKDIVIPQYMIDIYRSQTGDVGEIPEIFTRGSGVDPSNTVRSFYHQGNNMVINKPEQTVAILTIKVLSKLATDDILLFYYHYYSEKNRMRYHTLISQKNEKKKKKKKKKKKQRKNYVVCYNFAEHFKG